MTDLTAVTTDELMRRAHLAGWKPESIRRTYRDLEAGTHKASEFLSADALAETLANMTAAIEKIEREGREADAELERRRAAVPTFTGYVS